MKDPIHLKKKKKIFKKFIFNFPKKKKIFFQSKEKIIFLSKPKKLIFLIKTLKKISFDLINLMKIKINFFFD